MRVLRPLEGGPAAAQAGAAAARSAGCDRRRRADAARAGGELDVEAASLLAPARRLAALGAAELDWREVGRDPLAHREQGVPLRHALADEQRVALEAIENLPPGGELLLEGVAAAGKTDVYLAAMESTLAAGRGVIAARPGGLAGAAAGGPGARPGGRASWPSCTAACRPGNDMTSGGGSCAARPRSWSARGQPSSRRCRSWA